MIFGFITKYSGVNREQCYSRDDFSHRLGFCVIPEGVSFSSSGCLIQQFWVPDTAVLELGHASIGPSVGRFYFFFFFFTFWPHLAACGILVP